MGGIVEGVAARLEASVALARGGMQAGTVGDAGGANLSQSGGPSRWGRVGPRTGFEAESSAAAAVAGSGNGAGSGAFRQAAYPAGEFQMTNLGASRVSTLRSSAGTTSVEYDDDDDDNAAVVL